MRIFPAAGLLAAFFLAGCIYEAPLVPKPVQPVDARFIGNWTQAANPGNRMFIRAFDSEQYVIMTVDGTNTGTYRAYTCDVEGLALANVQDLAPGSSAALKWAFFSYRLNASGQLVVRMINDKVLTPQTTTSAGLRDVIRENLQNPSLFLEETVYEKVPQ